MRSRSKRNTFALHELKHRLHQNSNGARPHTNADVNQTKCRQTTKSKKQNNKHSKANAERKISKKRNEIKSNNRRQGILNAAEKMLFRQAMQGVEPLKHHNRHPSVVEPKPKTSTCNQNQQLRKAHAQEHSHVLNTELSDDYYPQVYGSELTQEYLNPICGTDVLRNLKRGRWPLEASIDLHGATLDQARQRLQHFLQHCLAEEYRCIRIVHGKGYRSLNGEPVLLIQIRRWLTQLHQVLAFCNCPPNEGGRGAVKVLLRKPKSK